MPKQFLPDAAILRGIAQGRVGWFTAIGEWIDNAFDRKAKKITITFERGQVVIEDDGEGTAEPENIVVLGLHTAAEGNGLAEFGMGGTEALLWAGGEKGDVDIFTVHSGTARRLSMNWTDYSRSQWTLPDPSVRQADLKEVGTRIIVKPLAHKAPRDVDSLCQELGYIYSHALRQRGKTIEIKSAKRSVVVQPWQPPEFQSGTPKVNTEIVVNGKVVHIYAGVVKEGATNTHPGLTYWFGYRVILPGTSSGCGNFNPSRICGFIELKDEKWRSVLTRNKNDLNTEDSELFIEIEKAIKSVLEAAEKAGSTFIHRELSSQIESRIGEIMGMTRLDAKAKRTKKPEVEGKQPGSVKPVGTERQHRRAANEQDGDTFASRIGRTLTIGFEKLGGTKLGHVMPPMIMMNLDNEFIREAYAARHVDTLTVLVVIVLCHWDEGAKGKGKLLFPEMENLQVLEKLGKILATSPSLGGKVMAKAGVA